jgi:tRNA (guanine37-N1)-methyltransferase
MDRFLSESILGRAREKNLVKINLYDLRDFTEDRHRSVDDEQYGGGAGMVLKPDPLFKAVRHVLGRCESADVPVWLTSPGGRVFDNTFARELAAVPEQILLCGHYGGVDERVRENLVTGEISIGDYVLTGGEIAAIAIIDASARFVPGVVGNEQSVAGDTLADGLLGPPQYTRPAAFEGLAVPEVLISGHHANIQTWQRRMKLENTFRRRPDLLDKANLSRQDIELLQTFGYTRKEK